MNPYRVQMNVSDHVSVKDASESLPHSSNLKAPDGLDLTKYTTDSESTLGGAGTDWFTRLTWFIPKEIREPWRGDILEDRDKMAGEGRSRLYIEWASGTQLLCLLFSRLWARIAWFWLIYTRLSEWFTHNR